MPEAIERIIADVNASMEMDEAIPSSIADIRITTYSIIEIYYVAKKITRG